MKRDLLLVFLGFATILAVCAAEDEDYSYYKIRGPRKSYVVRKDIVNEIPMNDKTKASRKIKQLLTTASQRDQQTLPPGTKMVIVLTETLHEGARSPVDTQKELTAIALGKKLKRKDIDAKKKKLLMDELERLKEEVGASEIKPISTRHN